MLYTTAVYVYDMKSIGSVQARSSVVYLTGALR